jgi:response regulator RpfG family c-di-GMP phosphodiesterase
VKEYTRIVAEKFATMSAQLVLLADVYDALISERCYKAACSKEEAFHMKKVRLFM